MVMRKMMIASSGFLFFLLFLSINNRGVFLEETIEWMIFSLILIFVSIVDYDRGIIPDSAVILLAVNRIIFIVLFSSSAAETLMTSVFNGLVNSLLVFLSALFLSIKLKRPSMGFGDIKLLFSTGLYFSLPENQMIMIISCIGCIAAFCVVKKRKKLPFGPFITMGCLLVLLFVSLESV